MIEITKFSSLEEIWDAAFAMAYGHRRRLKPSRWAWQRALARVGL